MLYVYSLILSRGAAVIREDMDEPAALTADFGHCTQVCVYVWPSVSVCVCVSECVCACV